MAGSLTITRLEQPGAAGRFALSRPARVALAAGLLLLYFGLIATAAAISQLHPPGVSSTTEDISLLLGFTVYPLVGCLIIAYHPENRLGWLFYLVGFGGAISAFGTEYARYGLLANPGALPLAVPAGYLSEIGWNLGLAPVLVYIPLLFPTGRPPRGRWQWVGWLTAAGLVWIMIIALLQPEFSIGVESDGISFANPLGRPDLSAVLSVLDQVGTAVMLAAIGAAALSVISRYRQAGLQERLQIKWVAFAVLLTAGSILLENIPGLPLITDFFFGLQIGLLPLAAAVAIFKYRLYDIDLILRKTLVYGLLTALLALLYFGVVTGLQALFSGLFAARSPLALVLSTLAIAALFNPLRRRVQGVVDRRFFRRKYVAAQVLADFAHTARDETDLRQLQNELLKVVTETLQPERTMLWLLPVRKS